MTDEAHAAILAELAAQFPLGPRSLHGPPHWATVEAHALRLARASGGDADVCRYFAAFHDAARLDEGHDHGHGERGAALALQYRAHLPLTDHQMTLLTDACRGHELGGTSGNPTVGSCWDADRLDLVRVGVIPRAAYMSTAAGQAAARDLTAWHAGR